MFRVRERLGLIALSVTVASQVTAAEPSAPSLPLRPSAAAAERPLFEFAPLSLSLDLGPVMPRTPSPSSSGEAVRPSFSDYHRALGFAFTRGLFDRDHVLPIVVGTAATLAVLPFADEISDAVRGKWDALGNAGDVAGGPAVMYALTAGLMLAVPFTENERFEGFAFTLSQAMIVDTAVIQGIKFAVDRTRPNRESENSFPSGHTSHTVTLATVAQHHYGSKLGLPLYAMAGLVGLSRIEKGKHFLGDVLFGATLGYVSARAAIAASEHFRALRNVSVAPDIGPRRYGFRVSVSF